jgi:Carboxypeptidase regulatory-like domain/TonB-dependent Receptor Plug Domain
LPVRFEWVGSRAHGLPLSVLLLFLQVVPAAAQKATLTGRVRTDDGRGIAAASIIIRLPSDSIPLRATQTDALGRFRILELDSGHYELEFRSLGYETRVQAIAVGTGPMVIELVTTVAPIVLEGVSVEADRARTRFEQEAGTTTRELTRAELKRTPGVAEADVIRAIEVLPGVVSTSDYTSSFNVRGGSADQNLILIDGFPIYNPFHLGGLFSVFNADMVSRAELMAGGFPAQYGGRVSSVLSVESDASGTGTTIDGGISLLAARAAVGFDAPSSVAGGLGLATARARVSLRRSYFDALFKPFFDFPYHLTDLQAVAEGWTRGGSRFKLTAYTGRDVLDLAGSDSFPLRINWGWGNDVIGLQYTSAMGGGRTMQAKLGFTRFSTGLNFPDFGDTEFRSRIDQLSMGADFDVPLGSARFAAGAAADRYSYDNLAQTGGTVFQQGRSSSWLLGGYVQTRWDPGSWLIEAGGRIDAWSAGAIGTTGAAIDVTPRVAIKRFIGGRDFAVKLAAGRYTQYVHSVRDEELPLGIDVWVLAGDRAPRVLSNQAQIGIEAFTGRGWNVSLEAYSRDLTGVVTVNAADDPNDATDDLTPGKGRARGLDFYVRRDAGRLRPTLAISWLRATRTFADATSGRLPPPEVEYAPIFDRRLDVEFTLQTILPGNVEGGLRWNFGSGLPYTRPQAGYTTFSYGIADGRLSFEQPADSPAIAIVLGARNAERYPAYHRLDISLRKTYTKTWGRITPYLDVLNVYNRRNPLFYFYEFDAMPPTRSGVSMFPLLPTLGAEISFR